MMCSARLNFHPPAQSPFATPPHCHPSPSANLVILSAAKDLAAPCGTPVRSLQLTLHGDSTSPNTFQRSTDGQPRGPHPHVHTLPCPYYTRAWRADSSYSRGERGEDAGRWALVVARPGSSLHPSLYLKCIGHKGPPPASLPLPPLREAVPSGFPKSLPV